MSEIIKIPRYVPEGVRNYNGIELESNSLNKSFDNFLKVGHCYLYKYKPYDDHNKKPGGFYTNDLMDIIGSVKSYDKENVYVILNKEVEFNNPVALITSVGVMQENDVYKVDTLVRVEVAEEDNLERPRIKLEKNN